MAQDKNFARLIRTFSTKGLPEQVRRALAQSVRKHATLIQRHIRAEMKRPKHGRVYVYKGRPYTASAPGEAPAIRSGALYRAIIPQFSRDGLQARFAPRVLGKAPYPRFLEQGTIKMAPRPYLRPGVDMWRKAFLADAKAIVKAALKK